MTRDELALAGHPIVDDLIAASDGARTLGMSDRGIRKAIAAGRLWGTKVGSEWVTSRQSLEQYRRWRLEHWGAPMDAAS